MAVVSDVTVRLRVDMSEVTSSMREISGVLSKTALNQSLGTIVSAMNSASDAMIDFGKTSYSGFAEFERGVSKVSAMAGITGDALDLIRDRAMELGGTTEFTSKEVIDAFQAMALAGWQQEEMLSAIDAALNLATISGLDFGNVTSYMINAIAPFGLAASDAEQVVDLFARTATAANFNINDLAKSFEYVAPIAGAMGYEMKDVNVALALLANNGLKGSKAGTALRRILTDLNSAAEDGSIAIGDYSVAISNADGTMRPLTDVLKDMSVAFEGLTEAERALVAEDLVGKTGMAGFLALMNGGVKEIDAMTAEVYDFNGASQEMADTIRGDAMGGIDDLSSAWDNLRIKVGEALHTVLEPVLDWVTNAIQWFNGLDEETRNLVVSIGGIAAITMGVIGAFMALMPVIAAIGFVATSSFSWVFWIPVAIAAVIAAGWALVANWDSIKKWFKDMCDKVKEWFSEAGDWIVEKWTSVVEWFKGIPSAISTWFNETKEKVKTAFTEMANAMVEKFNYFFTEYLPSLPMKFAEWLNDLLKAGIQMFEDLVNGGVNAFNSFFEFLASIPERWRAFWADLKAKAEELIALAISTIQQKFNEFITWCAGLPQRFRDACSAIADKARELGALAKQKFEENLTAFISWCKGLPDKFKSAINSMGDKAKEVGSKVVDGFKKGISVVKDWIKNFFGTIFDGVHIKTPHFTFSGSMNPLKWASEGVPKIGVKWYAKGGIFSGPSVIGVGESGDEAVIPLNNRTKVRPFAQAVAAELGAGGGGGMTINVQQLVVREEADVRKVAQELYRLQQYKSRGRGSF